MGIEFFALPLEEYLFFLCIPYSSLFIHFCKEKLTPKLKFSNLTTKFFVIGLTSFLLIISILNFNKFDNQLDLISNRYYHANVMVRYPVLML